MLQYIKRMETSRFISIKVVVDRIMARPIFTTLAFDNAVRWAIWVLQAIDNPNFYHKKIANIHISSYRGTIPYDFVGCEKTEVIETDSIPGFGQRFSMLTSGDPFLKDARNRQPNPERKLDFTYRIEGDYIFTDFNIGKLQMAYWALPTDTDGYIMVPDIPSVIQAIESYIKFRHLEILADIQQVPYNLVEKEEQNYAWYIAQAQSKQFMSNLDTMEQMINIQGQLLPNRHLHRTGYDTLGRKEYMKRI
jgi:hypothetical protein